MNTLIITIGSVCGEVGGILLNLFKSQSTDINTRVDLIHVHNSKSDILKLITEYSGMQYFAFPGIPEETDKELSEEYESELRFRNADIGDSVKVQAELWRLHFEKLQQRGQLTPLDELLANCLTAMENAPDTTVRQLQIVFMVSLCGSFGSAIFRPLAEYVKEYVRLHRVGSKPVMKSVLLTPELFEHAYHMPLHRRIAENAAWELSDMQSSGKCAFPVDVGALYHRYNLNGRLLRDPDTWKQHLAETLFTTTMLSVCDDVNLAEEEIRRILPSGQGIIAGYGSAILRYPRSGIVRYLAAYCLQRLLGNMKLQIADLCERCMNAAELGDALVPAAGIQGVRILEQRVRDVLEMCEKDKADWGRRYTDNLGVPIRYVLGNEVCLKDLSASVEKQLLACGEQLFKKLMEILMQPTIPMVEDIMPIWAEWVDEACCADLPKDVFMAVTYEEKLCAPPGTVCGRYIDEVLRSVERLAAPFIDPPLGSRQVSLQYLLYHPDEFGNNGNTDLEWTKALCRNTKLIEATEVSKYDLRILRGLYLPGTVMVDALAFS